MLRSWIISLTTNLVLQYVLLQKVRAVGQPVRWMMTVVVIEIALAVVMVRDVSDGEHTMQILSQQSAKR